MTQPIISSGAVEPSTGANYITPQPSAPVDQPKRWDPLFWSYRQQAGLHFSSTEELDAVIDRFWNDSELQGLPRVYVGENTVIVPAEAVDYLHRKGHQFTVKPVVSAGDLPADEINKIRRHT